MKTCTKCGIEKELTDYHRQKSSADGHARQCKKCANAQSKKYRENNSVKIKEYKRQYFQKNKDKVYESRRRYEQNNIDAVRKRRKKYYQEVGKPRYQENYRKNREHYQAKDQEYYQNNREYIKKRTAENYRQNRESYLATASKYRKNNPEVVRSSHLRRRARLVDADDGTVTSEFLNNLIKKNTTCYYCGVELEGKGHVEHMTPLSRGGLHSVNNLTMSCASCNLSKGTKTAEEFLTSLTL